MTNQKQKSKLDIKQVFKKNINKIVVLGFVLLTIFLVLKYIDYRQKENNIKAANLYQNIVLLQTNDSANSKMIIDRSKQLIKLYPHNIYAAFAAWTIVKYKIDYSNKSAVDKTLSSVGINSNKVNLEDSMVVLENTIKNINNDDVIAITKIRLARIMLELKKTDPAIKTLKSINNKAYFLSRDLVLGDAYILKGNNVAARNIYKEALAVKYSLNSVQIKNIIKMKLENIK